MALALKDRVKETTTTTGTGTVTLAGAASGFQSFAAVGDGNQTFYAIVDSTSGDWEVGVGTYTSSGTTLSRTTVVSSSNAGSLVNFGAGSKDVFVTYPSSRSVYLDAAGSAVTTLDIGTLGASTANITTANITSGTVSTTPTSGNDIVNKTYVDTLAASGIHFHQPVRVESPINLTATYNNGTAGVGATLTNAGAQAALVIDGVTVSVNDRVLVYEQTTQTQNGIYVVTDTGSGSTNWILTRSSDADTYVINSADGLSEGSTVFVQQGATGAGETYTCNTSGVITFGTTNITFAQISSAQIYSAGTGLSLSGTQFSITNTGTAGTYGSASSVPVITTNAQGQVTGVTPTAIAITGAAVSGNISGQAGSVANALTAGTYLTSGGTYNGSAARTFAVDATDANTASKVVARDASGNFSAGTITATLSGAATSATTATNLAGGAANRIPFQSGAGATSFAVAPTASNQVLNWNGSAFTWSAGTISGVALGSNLNTLTFGTFLTGTSYNGSGAVTLATNATNANTGSTLVARDASGNFSAGTITAALNGNASTATTASNVNNGTLTMNVSGTGLSGSQTFTANQAGNATFTVTSNATNANTGSTIVARDASGNFSAGTITAALNGNASTATSATSATTATNLAGGSAGTIPYQSAAGTTVQLAAGTFGQVLRSSGVGAPSWINGTISGVSLGSNLNTLTMNTSGNGLSGSTTYNGSGGTTFTVASNATRSNTGNSIVFRDGSGDFDAGAINITRGLTSDPSGSQALRVVSPGFASFYTSSATGALQIQLPSALGAAQTMLRMRISVWTFDGQSFDIYAGAYLFNLGVSNNFAYMLTGSRPALNTRWGWDGSRWSFFIGDIGNVWSYPIVNVTDVQVGFSSYTTSIWTSGWNIQANNSSYGSVYAGPTSILPQQQQLVSGTSIKTINGNSLVGSGNLSISASPAGSNTQLQFNNSGSFGASNGLTWNGSKLYVSGVEIWGSNSGDPSTSVGIGGGALFSSTSTSYYNTAVGGYTLYANTGGDFNTGVGYFALRFCTDGNYNVGIGPYALNTLTTANFSTAVGNEALYSSTGGENTAVGNNAGRTHTTGTQSSYFGAGAGRAITSGAQNTMIGAVAGNTAITGNNNTCVGYNAQVASTSTSNSVTLGSTAVSVLRCQVTTITSTSDERDKKDVQPLTGGLQLLRTVEPVRFVWNMRDGGQVGNADTGFIAQQLQQAQITADVEVPGLVYDANPDKLEAGYGKLLPFAISAIKQLDATVEELRTQLAELKAELNTLKGS